MSRVLAQREPTHPKLFQLQGLPRYLATKGLSIPSRYEHLNPIDYIQYLQDEEDTVGCEAVTFAAKMLDQNNQTAFPVTKK